MKLPASYGRFEQEYCILRELGSGGEGKVYLVRHQVTEQLRAAKRLWKGTDADRLHELKMMKRLRHPSLPEVIDVLPEKDCIWLIMTYVKGQMSAGAFWGWDFRDGIFFDCRTAIRGTWIFAWASNADFAPGYKADESAAEKKRAACID